VGECEGANVGSAVGIGEGSKVVGSYVGPSVGIWVGIELGEKVAEHLISTITSRSVNTWFSRSQKESNGGYAPLSSLFSIHIKSGFSDLIDQ